ncbi:MAG: alpha/beta hydrolase [Gemmataceae bacterium]|nr:alpha/beta hydrolase [Gemmataceae bacterium]
MRRLSLKTWFLTVSLVFAGLTALGSFGCALRHRELIVPKTPIPRDGVVFAADGAGNFQAASKNFRAAVQKSDAPLDVITVPWSHGDYRMVADQIDEAHARQQGAELAATIEKLRDEQPGARVHLLGHCAGSMVILAALEELPPDSVECVFLLSPSVSARYDLRPALRAVSRGLHVYYSKFDMTYLGWYTGIIGNADRRWGPSSGRIGFEVSFTPEEVDLVAKLHQHPWKPWYIILGNNGGHFGNYQPEFVRKHILPLVLKP